MDENTENIAIETCNGFSRVQSRAGDLPSWLAPWLGQSDSAPVAVTTAAPPAEPREPGDDLDLPEPETFTVRVKEFPAIPSTWHEPIDAVQYTPEPVDAPEGILCTRCGCRRYRDFPVHNGQSIRRDCARCSLTVNFPIWYGRQI